MTSRDIALLRMMPTNKRKYYKSNEGGVSAAQRTFLLKWLDEEDGSIKHEAFSQEKDVTKKLTTYLKAGVCSWVVSYYD